MISQLTPGQKLARGTRRHLLQHNFVCLDEFTPVSGLRVDLMAVGPKGELWVIECKSSRVDFATDQKWHRYLDYCDRFFWAIDVDFPSEVLPEETGLILADSFDAEIVRFGEKYPLSAARRRKLLIKFGRNAASRYMDLREAAMVRRIGPAPALAPSRKSAVQDLDQE